MKISKKLYELPLRVDTKWMLIPGLHDRIDQKCPAETKRLYDSMKMGVDQSSFPVSIFPTAYPYEYFSQVRNADGSGYKDEEHDAFVTEFRRREEERPFDKPENEADVIDWLENVVKNGLYVHLCGKHRFGVRVYRIII